MTALSPFPAQRVTGGVLLHPWLSLQAPSHECQSHLIHRVTGRLAVWQHLTEWVGTLPAWASSTHPQQSCTSPWGTWSLLPHTSFTPLHSHKPLFSHQSPFSSGELRTCRSLFGMLFHPIFSWLVSPLARVSPPYPWPSLKSQSKNSTGPCSSISLCSVFILSHTSTYFLTNLLSGFPSWIRTPWG